MRISVCDEKMLNCVRLFHFSFLMSFEYFRWLSSFLFSADVYGISMMAPCAKNVYEGNTFYLLLSVIGFICCRQCEWKSQIEIIAPLAFVYHFKCVYNIQRSLFRPNRKVNAQRYSMSD